MCLKYFKLHVFAPAIFRASYKGDIDRLEQLIEKGVNVNAHERDGLTPLMVASLRGEKAAVKILIERGADINDRDNNGMTPLTHALQNTWLHRNLDRMINKIKAMTSGDQTDSFHYYYSDPSRYNDVAEMLISNGADVEFADAQNMTPLMHTAILGNEEIAALLLTRGANVNATNKDGATPLMLAILGGCPNIVKMLIEYGSNVNYCNDEGISVMTVASYKNNKEILELLRTKGAKGEVMSCLLRKK